jgi:hypothetical protein
MSVPAAPGGGHRQVGIGAGDRRPDRRAPGRQVALEDAPTDPHGVQPRQAADARTGQRVGGVARLVITETCERASLGNAKNWSGAATSDQSGVRQG